MLPTAPASAQGHILPSAGCWVSPEGKVNKTQAHEVHWGQCGWAGPGFGPAKLSVGARWPRKEAASHGAEHGRVGEGPGNLAL